MTGPSIGVGGRLLLLLLLLALWFLCSFPPAEAGVNCKVTVTTSRNCRELAFPDFRPRKKRMGCSPISRTGRNCTAVRRGYARDCKSLSCIESPAIIGVTVDFGPYPRKIMGRIEGANVTFAGIFIFRMHVPHVCTGKLLKALRKNVLCANFREKRKSDDC